MFNREHQVEHLYGVLGTEPIIVAPYDAELFGHWWFEGPIWLEALLRKIDEADGPLRTATPSDYLADGRARCSVHAVPLELGLHGLQRGLAQRHERLRLPASAPRRRSDDRAREGLSARGGLCGARPQPGRARAPAGAGERLGLHHEDRAPWPSTRTSARATTSPDSRGSTRRSGRTRSTRSASRRPSGATGSSPEIDYRIYADDRARGRARRRSEGRHARLSCGDARNTEACRAPKLDAILWHQHQPFYRTHLGGDPKGAYLLPWVRLHAVRDYYAMAELVAEYPNVHVTINLVPSLMVQLDDYAENGATDEWMELSVKPVSSLDDVERDFIVARFFDADWQNEVRIHKRYAELLRMREKGRSFSDHDMNDLMCGSTSRGSRRRRDRARGRCRRRPRVGRPVRGQGARLHESDIEEVLGEQLKLMRNVIPLHRQLMDEGRIEVSVTPFYHPILPILVDSDRATIDAAGSTLPPRFAHPEDARAHIERAVALYEEKFGRKPAGHVAVRGVGWASTSSTWSTRPGSGGGRPTAASSRCPASGATRPRTRTSCSDRTCGQAREAGVDVLPSHAAVRRHRVYDAELPRLRRRGGGVPDGSAGFARRVDDPSGARALDHPRRRERVGLLPQHGPRVPARSLQRAQR